MIARMGFVVLMLAGFAACSAYHPLKDGIGFKDEPVGVAAYRVTYRGNGKMPIDEAWRYALVRAAELATLQDAAYLQIESQRIDLDPSSDYFPGVDRSFRESVGVVTAVITHIEVPSHMEYLWIPTVTLQVRLATQPGPNEIPVSYLLRHALAENIALSTATRQHLAKLPEVSGEIGPPSAPTPTLHPVGTLLNAWSDRQSDAVHAGDGS